MTARDWATLAITVAFLCGLAILVPEGSMGEGFILFSVREVAQ